MYSYSTLLSLVKLNSLKRFKKIGGVTYFCGESTDGAKKRVKVPYTEVPVWALKSFFKRRPMLLMPSDVKRKIKER